MAWIELTPQAVKARLSALEYEHYNAAAEHAHDFDMLEEIIIQVIALVRGKVRACRSNLAGVGPAGTIPDECLHAAATIARASLCAAFPVSEGETDLRASELRDANAFLDKVAEGGVSIESATGGAVPGAEPFFFGGGRLHHFRQ